MRAISRSFQTDNDPAKRASPRLTVNAFCKCVRVNVELVNVEFWRDFGFYIFFLNLKKEKTIWNEKECFLRGYFSNNILCKLEDCVFVSEHGSCSFCHTFSLVKFFPLF